MLFFFAETDGWSPAGWQGSPQEIIESPVYIYSTPFEHLCASMERTLTSVKARRIPDFFMPVHKAPSEKDVLVLNPFWLFLLLETYMLAILQGLIEIIMVTSVTVGWPIKASTNWSNWWCHIDSQGDCFGFHFFWKDQKVGSMYQKRFAVSCQYNARLQNSHFLLTQLRPQRWWDFSKWCDFFLAICSQKLVD